ncbi:MAG: hypothetical protein ACREGI_04935 [Candidatus Levyibacteriota bacterium]
MTDNPQTASVARDLRDYALTFFDAQLQKYGNDSRIGKFYIGNEYPDKHAIEGVSGVTMSFAPDFMEELAKRAKQGTTKQIALNTNKYPTDFAGITSSFGRIFNILGNQGVLGIDTYPTREGKYDANAYGRAVAALKAYFPQTQFAFTEYQCEPYATGAVAGKPWTTIFADHPDIFRQFYQGAFPRSLDSHMAPTEQPPSNMREVNLWGAPAWLIAKRMGYTFPLQMIGKIAGKMANAA